MKRSVLIAIAVTAVLAIWVLSGVLFSAAPEEQNFDAPSNAANDTFAVRTKQIHAEDYVRELVIRGRSEAIRAVELKSEIDGQVVATPAERGRRVKKGDVICRIAEDDRAANLAQARALAEQRRLEFEAAKDLAEKGHRSATQLAQSFAQYEAALAQVNQMEIAIKNTALRAPFDALVERRPADIGDFLQKGQICAFLIDENSFHIVGEVSEREVGAVELGATAHIRFATGQETMGTVRFISSTAEERTRTFRVEVAIGNDDRRVRESLTADIILPVERLVAHRVLPTALVLDPNGKLGVRAVDANDKVVFHPITILADDGSGLWVKGLPDTLRLIAVGQEFVSAGQTVRTVEVKERESST